ncbi:hypothetical protein MPTK1_6g20690 [Marchantia polymorpha subsp. ruderalis]|uniref:Uncharacterized protein n=2 Tax=Marchantia polymorpha TaxID=3197 RepID=A0AAF6BU92_MARPO|nr:hypothetical protein MARPO_0091s0088 [Marchantia polymorpha]BBN15576.1 hypothetical protein Mp_6g20690 [Marchantia polymorpha subsp. ruderalis]|eukprot:PTQ33244.1 hypothetical protein MARPO_0091s0088 [Marchantia polymorpha]
MYLRAPSLKAKAYGFFLVRYKTWVLYRTRECSSGKNGASKDKNVENGSGGFLGHGLKAPARFQLLEFSIENRNPN